MSLLLCTRSPRRTNKVFFNENTNRAWDNKRVLEREREREPMLRAYGELYCVTIFFVYI